MTMEKSDNSSQSLISLEFIVDFLRKHPCSEPVLRLLEEKLFTEKFDCDSDEKMKEIVVSIGPAFICWNSAVRIAALRSMIIFYSVLLVQDSSNEFLMSSIQDPDGVFSILLEAETTPLSIETYRKRLILLRKLVHGPHIGRMPCEWGKDWEWIPLKVILAQFYENFSLLWPAVFEIAISYARGMQIDAFWAVFEPILQSANDMELQKEETAKLREFFPDINVNESTSRRPDLAMFRLHLWKFLSQIPDIAEPRTRIISPIFMEITRDEFKWGFEGSGKSENLLEHDVDTRRNSIETRRSSRKTTVQVLLAILDTYGQFKDPKSVYLEPQIRDLYDELLMVPDSVIQKSVLRCLFSYKRPYLNRYRDNLNRLIDDKTFPDEIVLFSIDSQSSIVESVHRKLLMPFLLRLLYGKLQTRLAASSSFRRRSTVFRFLAGCEFDELATFLDILFFPLKTAINNGSNLREMCEQIETSFDVTQMVPLKQLKSVLNSAGQVIRKVAPVFEGDHSNILYRVLISTAVLVRLAMQSDGVQTRHLKVLKKLRLFLCKRLKETVRFLDGTATVLSTIASCADANARSLVSFFPLLNIPLFTVDSRAPVTALSAMMATLVRRSTRKPVQDLIVNGLSNLLTLADSHLPLLNGSESLPQRAYNHAKRDRRHLSSRFSRSMSCLPMTEVNLGTKLVLEELPNLLNYLWESMPGVDSKQKSKMVSRRHLDILQGVSEFVHDAQMSRRISSTLLTYLERSLVKSCQLQTVILTTIGRLLASVPDSHSFLGRLAPFFSSISLRESRNALVFILNSIGQSADLSANGRRSLELVQDLCSWNSKRLDEPDYERRHRAFDTLNGKFTDSHCSLDATFLVLVAHCDYFAICEMSDMSLRTGASFNFRKLIDCISRHFTSVNLDEHLLPLVKMGLKNDNESVRHEFVSSLVALIDAFPNHQKLAHLRAIRVVDEPDLDFFENITHIQMHRRQRAMKRLTDRLKDGELAIPSHVILPFVFPLCRPYMLAAVSKTAAVADEAVRLFGQILSTTPWKRYLRMLEYYLNRLQNGDEKQKSLVRTISTILESFHYDITGPIPERKAEIEKSPSSTPPTNLSAKMYETMVKQVLPRLKKCLDKKGESYSAHKKSQDAKRHYDEDDQLLRAPVALSMIKLLQKLPAPLLDQNLPGIVVKLTVLLKSRSGQVRESARNTLVSVVDALGPKYLAFVIRELKTVLLRGYQVHVMIYTVHVLLSKLATRMNSGDVDGSLEDVIEICQTELFSDVTEEKEVKEITRNVHEAKTNKSMDTYQMLGRFIGKWSLGVVVQPMKELLDSKPGVKTTKKLGELLRHFAFGLAQNSGLDTTTLLIFAHQTLTDGVNGLSKSSVENDHHQIDTTTRADCLLLPSEPTRIGVRPKTSTTSKMHIFIEFALQLLDTLLRTKRLYVADAGDVARLDPFVALIVECLTTKYDKVLTNALRCITGCLAFPLPHLRAQLTVLIDRLFLLLVNYAGMGAAGAKGNVFELSQAIFKTLTAVIRDSPNLTLSKKKLSLLLHYVETDMLDTQKQATAFSLLKAIIARKSVDEQLDSVMERVRELAITSQTAHVRAQCRQTLLLYAADKHPVGGKRPRMHIEYLLTQLDFPFEDGRVSLLEMLCAFFDRLHQPVLGTFSSLCLVKLSLQLVNDTSDKCRKLITVAIGRLFDKVSSTKRDELFQIAIDWLNSDKFCHKSLAAQILVCFAESEETHFGNARFDTILPLFALCFQQEAEREPMVQIASSLTRIIELCPEEITDKEQSKRHLRSLIERVTPLLRAHDSSAIQLAISVLFHRLFTVLKSSFSADSASSIREMCQHFIWQLKGKQVTAIVAEQAVKNLLFLTDYLKSDMDLEWLAGTLASICRFELSNQPYEAVKRLNVFKWVAVVAANCSESKLNVIVEYLLPILNREMSGKSARHTNDLQRMAGEVGEVIQLKMGTDSYAKKLSECHKMTAEKSNLRKRKIAEEAVTEPELTAIMKQKKQRAKRTSKRRRILREKPYKRLKLVDG